MTTPLPNAALIREVGPPDGLQSIARIVPTARKDDGGTIDVVRLPLLLDGRRPGVRRPLPRIGEQTDEILGHRASRRGVA